MFINILVEQAFVTLFDVFRLRLFSSIFGMIPWLKQVLRAAWVSKALSVLKKAPRMLRSRRLIDLKAICKWDFKLYASLWFPAINPVVAMMNPCPSVISKMLVVLAFFDLDKLLIRHLSWQ